MGHICHLFTDGGWGETGVQIPYGYRPKYGFYAISLVNGSSPTYNYINADGSFEKNLTCIIDTTYYTDDTFPS